MNILIPDSWLREFLITDATPADIMRCLSLSGPSVERIIMTDGQPVYDIEITTNRVDAFSVFGIAREAAVILPEYGYSAVLKQPSVNVSNDNSLPKLDITVVNDPALVSRILAVRISGLTKDSSPELIRKRLEAVGQRPLNPLVDITNYVMWEIGHPVHVFDYHALSTKKIIIREARKKESFTTLDGKSFKTAGGEIVFDNGQGEIIDLPSIMGTENSALTDVSTEALLFIENSDPAKIRFASMSHGIRTQAAVINEKHPDTATARLAFDRALTLALSLPGTKQASRVYDHSEKEPEMQPVTVSGQLIDSYLGKSVAPVRIRNILTGLGMRVTAAAKKNQTVYTVLPPRYRADITIAEDVVEEVARITGYHTIPAVLPSGMLPDSMPDQILQFEEKVKILLRGWGVSELMTYSMISAEQMNAYGLPTVSAYRIRNPLTSDHVFMRPSLAPNFLDRLAHNVRIQPDVNLFELSNIYEFRKEDLPREIPKLIMGTSGVPYRKFKGLAEALLTGLGIASASGDEEKIALPGYMDGQKCTYFSRLGYLGCPDERILKFHQLPDDTYLAEFDIVSMITQTGGERTYIPIPKYPAAHEDLALIVPTGTRIGPVISYISSYHDLITDAALIDIHGDTRTVRVTYRSEGGNLTALDIKPLRMSLLEALTARFGIRLKT